MQQISPTTEINSPTQINKKEKKSIKEKFDEIPDGTKKIGLALAALGTIAIAGVAIYKNKSSKAKKALSETAEQATKPLNIQQPPQKIIEEVKDKNPDIIITPPKPKTQPITAADVGKKQKQKKLQKKKLKELEHNLKEQKNNNIKKENERLVSITRDVRKNTNDIKVQRQTFKNSNDIDFIQNQMDLANEAAKISNEKANNLNPTFTDTTTRKQRILKQRTYNQNTKAQLENQKTQQKGKERIEQIKKENIRKQKAIEELKSSPNYELGLEKMKENAKVTNTNKAKRKHKIELEKFEKKFQNKNSHYLTALINNNKVNDIEAQAILNILSKRGIV